MAENLILVELKAEGQASVEKEILKVAGAIDTVGKEFENLNNTVDLAKKKLATMKEGSKEFKALQSEIKATEITMKSMGNSTSSLKAELRAMKGEIGNMVNALNQMESAGLGGTEQFRILEQQMLETRARAGELSDTIGDISDEISRSGSDTSGLDKTVGALQAVGGAFQAGIGITALFGSENEDLQKTLVKLNAVMAITSGAQQFFSEALKKDSLLYPIVTKAQRLWTIAVGETAGVMKVLRTALASIGIGLIIAGLALLIQNFDKVKKAILSVFPELDGLGAKIKTFVNEGLLSIVNGFIETYNKSLFLRNSLEGIADLFISIKDVGVLAFKSVGNAIGTVFKAIKAGLSGENPFTVLKQGFDDIFNDFKETGKKIVKNFTEKDLPNQLEKVKSIDVGKLFSGGSKAGEKIGKEVKDGIDKEVVGAFDALNAKIQKAKTLLENLKTEQVENGKDNTIQIKSLIVELEHYEDVLKRIENLEISLGVKPFIPQLEEDIEEAGGIQAQVNIKIGSGGIEQELDKESQRAKGRVGEFGIQIGKTLKDKIKEGAGNLFGFERGDDKQTKGLKVLQATQELSQGVTNILNQANAIRTQNEIAELEKRKQLGLISEKKYQSELNKIRRKEAERQKKQAVFQALLAVPVAILNALSTGGAKAIPQAIIAGVLAAAQLAIVVGTPLPKFRKGGLIGGKLHTSGGTQIEAERGEFIMKREAVKNHGLKFMESVNNGKLPKFDKSLNANLPNIEQMISNVIGVQFGDLSDKFNELNGNFAYLEQHLKEGKLNGRESNKYLKTIANKNKFGYA
jgi:hypothetical protein